MAEEPKSGEVQLALFVGSKIANGLVGAAVDQLITSPILKLVGIKKTDDSAEKYRQEVMTQLAGLGQSLNNQVRALQTTLTQIKSISTQIKEYLTEEALAQILRDYNSNASTIENLFQLFVDDVSVLSDQSRAEGALNDLYNNVLSSDNASKVSEAMIRIHDLVVQPSDFDKGILDYLQDIVQAEIQKYAETDDNYVHKFTREFDQNSSTYLLPRSFDYYDSAKIVLNGYQVAHAEVPKIAALFKQIISTQLRGLIFLSKAWEGSPHSSSLRNRANDVMAEIKMMKAFYPAYKTTVDQAVANSLKTNGKYLPDELLRQYTPRRDTLTWTNQTDPGGFLLHDWIMMRVEETSDDNSPEDRIWMLYQPWTDASQLPAGADRYCLALKMSYENISWMVGVPLPPNFQEDYLDGDVNMGNSTKFDEFIYPGLIKLSTDLPSELAGVLNGLPTSEEEVIKGYLGNFLESSSFQELALSFKCNLDGDTGVWLEGRSVTGALDLASSRQEPTSETSTAWRVFFTLMPPDNLSNVYVKCLGFDSEDAQYLNGKTDTNQLELAVNPDPAVAGGTEWMIRPWEDNIVSFVRVTGESTAWLEGKTDGSVVISGWAADQPGLKWSVYPYIADSGD